MVQGTEEEVVPLRWWDGEEQSSWALITILQNTENIPDALSDDYMCMPVLSSFLF